MTYTNETYTCVITGTEHDTCGGWYGGRNIQISEEGVEALIEQYIDRNKDRFGIIFFVYTLQQRFLKRIKRQNNIPPRLRKELLEKYKHTCKECGSKDRLEIDHIIPVSKGGKSDYKNLQVLCKPCNLKKSNKL